MVANAAAPSSLRNAPLILFVDLHHSQGPLRFVVIEWDGGVVEEAQHLVGFVAHATGEIPGGALVHVPWAVVTTPGWGPGGQQRECVVEGVVIAPPQGRGG